MDYHRLSELFEKVLCSSYTRVEGDGDYAIEKVDNHLYIYFQCSQTLLDWINNFDIAVVPYDGMEIPWKCHRGFLKVWSGLKPYIQEQIMDPTIKNITIVGYSHGAAIAVLAHEYVWYHRPDLRDKGLESYAFGCPRCYWGYGIPRKLQERWKNFTVIRNNNDIVSYMPPMLFGYTHVGSVHKIAYENTNPLESHHYDNYRKTLAYLKEAAASGPETV